MFDSWGKITGKDKRKAYPEQQGTILGRLGNFIMVFPYGFYCDLPAKAWFKRLISKDGNIAIPFTTKRPKDSKQGEPVFFHPETNTRIIKRNNGDVDVIINDNIKGNINIYTVQANIIADELIKLDAPLTRVTQNFEVGGSTSLQAVTSRGKDISDQHTHSGVQTGSGNTGGVNGN